MDQHPPTATYCHLLWESVFIDRAGDVFACSTAKPGVLGNLNREALTDIWQQSTSLRDYRMKALTGRLQCSAPCTILTPAQKAGLNRPQTYLDHPRNIWVDCGGSAMLDRTVSQEQVDWSKVFVLEFQGAEALAVPDAREFYRWLTDETGVRVNLITNGHLITDDWAERIVRAANWVQVAMVDANPDAVAGLERLVAAKRRTGAGGDVVYKYAISLENLPDLVGAIERAAALGCDLIAFTHDAEVFIHLRDHPEIQQVLQERVSQLMATAPAIRIDRRRLNQLGLLDERRKKNE